MKTITATNAKQNFGECITEAIREPLLINKSGRPSVVMLSYEEYQRLSELEDQYWLSRAEKAGREGFLSPEDSAAFMESKLASFSTRS